MNLGVALGQTPAGATPCTRAAPYVMPDDVEVSDGGEAGIVPADLQPSPIRKALPDTYHFPLAVDPLPATLPNASIDLGDVSVDRRTGETRLNGQPLSKDQAGDAAAGCDDVQKGAPR